MCNFLVSSRNIIPIPARIGQISVQLRRSGFAISVALTLCSDIINLKILRNLNFVDLGLRMSPYLFLITTGPQVKRRTSRGFGSEVQTIGTIRYAGWETGIMNPTEPRRRSSIPKGLWPHCPMNDKQLRFREAEKIALSNKGKRFEEALPLPVLIFPALIPRGYYTMQNAERLTAEGWGVVLLVRPDTAVRMKSQSSLRLNAGHLRRVFAEINRSVHSFR